MKKNILIVVLCFLITFILFPFKFINEKRVMNLNVSNDEYTKHIEKEIVLKIQGLYINPLFGDEFLEGIIQVDYNDQNYEYLNLRHHEIENNHMITIKRVTFPYGNMKDNFIFSNNFKDIVICQLENNKCSYEKNYVLSTFNSIEEVEKFIEFVK